VNRKQLIRAAQAQLEDVGPDDTVVLAVRRPDGGQDISTAAPRDSDLLFIAACLVTEAVGEGDDEEDEEDLTFHPQLGLTANLLRGCDPVPWEQVKPEHIAVFAGHMLWMALKRMDEARNPKQTSAG
jgi:hypothetical protein